MPISESVAYAEQLRLDGGRLVRMLRGHAFRRVPIDRPPGAVYLCERCGVAVERLDPAIQQCEWRRAVEGDEP